MITIRRHHVLIVRLVSTRVLSGRTALHVRLVGPILMAILRQRAMIVLRVTMLRLVCWSARRVLRVSTTRTEMRAQRV